VSEGFKHCPVCGRDLPREVFAKNRTRGDGLQGMCRECSRARCKTYGDSLALRTESSLALARPYPNGLVPHKEHVVPIVKGGAFVYGNIVPACRTCNSSKGIESHILWMLQRGYDLASFETSLAMLRPFREVLTA